MVTDYLKGNFYFSNASLYSVFSQQKIKRADAWFQVQSVLFSL